jgi:hypothetical protein
MTPDWPAIAALLGAVFAPMALPAADDFPSFASLPLLRRGVQTHQQSSYDRSGDNYDHEYFPLYTDRSGEPVLFDAYGPGLLTRQHMNIWRENAGGIRIRYWFDDETRPRIDADVSAFFSEANPYGMFQPPFSDNGGRDYRILYAPVYFRKRLKVTLSREPGGPGLEPYEPWTGSYKTFPKRRSHWYQYTYQLFTEDSGRPSWSPESAPAPRPYADLPKQSEAAMREFSTALAPGQKWDAAGFDGEGSIRELRLHLEPLTAETLAGVWLAIRFDGADRLQLEAPVGALFGGFPDNPQAVYASLLAGYGAGTGMYLRFPMPHWKSARIALENRSQTAVSRVALGLAHDPGVQGRYRKEDTGYFHAAFRRAFPRTEGRDYIYLDTAGHGHIAGHIAQRWETSMEENERTYFDGSATPQIEGNGFEDDQGFGWGLKNKTFPLFGSPVAKGGAGCLYRLFLPDLYVFYSGVRHGHQTYGPHSPRGHEGMYRAGSEQSVTFYYASDAPALRLTDELDVGNVAAEKKHRYRTSGRAERKTGAYWYDGEFNNVLFPHPALADDGRTVSGWSEFSVAIDPANRGVRLRRRTDKDNNRQLANVYVDGRKVTERPWYTVDYERTFRGIRWYDTSFEIPAKYTAGKRRIRLRIEHASSENGGIDEYFYWFWSYRP